MTLIEIKNYMKKNKITYAELSRRSDIPEGTLKHIFAKPETSNPQIYTMQAIEHALGLDKVSQQVSDDRIIEMMNERGLSDSELCKLTNEDWNLIYSLVARLLNK